LYQIQSKWMPSRRRRKKKKRQRDINMVVVVVVGIIDGAIVTRTIRMGMMLGTGDGAIMGMKMMLGTIDDAIMMMRIATGDDVIVQLRDIKGTMILHLDDEKRGTIIQARSETHLQCTIPNSQRTLDTASRLLQTHPRLSGKKTDRPSSKTRRNDWKRQPEKRSKNNENRLLNDIPSEPIPLDDSQRKRSDVNSKK